MGDYVYGEGDLTAPEDDGLTEACAAARSYVNGLHAEARDRLGIDTWDLSR